MSTDGENVISEGDERTTARTRGGKRLSAMLRFVEALVQLAKAHGMSVAELALAWVLRRPELTAAMVSHAAIDLSIMSRARPNGHLRRK